MAAPFPSNETTDGGQAQGGHDAAHRRAGERRGADVAAPPDARRGQGRSSLRLQAHHLGGGCSGRRAVQRLHPGQVPACWSSRACGQRDHRLRATVPSVPKGRCASAEGHFGAGQPAWARSNVGREGVPPPHVLARHGGRSRAAVDCSGDGRGRLLPRPQHGVPASAQHAHLNPPASAHCFVFCL